MEYYVYLLYRSNVIIYVGKGCDKRVISSSQEQSATSWKIIYRTDVESEAMWMEDKVWQLLTKRGWLLQNKVRPKKHGYLMEESRQSISDGTKVGIANMLPETKEKKNRAISKYQKELYESNREEYSQNSSKRLKDFHNSLTPEQKLERSKKISKSVKASQSLIDKENHSKRTKEGMKNARKLTPEEETLRREKIRQAAILQHQRRKKL